MVQQINNQTENNIIYPDSDGQPMADNTKQFRLIVTIKENLELLFNDNRDVFVAGDLLWYPIQGNNKLRRAPDVMVVFGRPKGDRGSYKQWEENNISPQVVFEILSPGNTLAEMSQKFEFYNRYGVEEYYVYDPDKIDLCGWMREENQLKLIEIMDGWISPRLKVRFEITENDLQLFTPTDEPFLTYVELGKLKQEAEIRAKQAEKRAQEAEAKVKELEAKLRELGQL
ncbi:unknown [Crocosphaera subtropica ATCC 51142]|uniref:Putative restriction endonuclease domain-containing protein n=1 Tax=Crocosphaera subtropica (strain ATCC 51142 / BH68) TaxID=43989 RepID=B1WQG0_CROS5|nr:Uma2 family endonuclease [Crocosphaera subtropica]ACB51671.1 unknown [Crocosphaera subtropica ATCC 51142]